MVLVNGAGVRCGRKEHYAMQQRRVDPETVRKLERKPGGAGALRSWLPAFHSTKGFA